MRPQERALEGVRLPPLQCLQTDYRMFLNWGTSTAMVREAARGMKR